MPTNSKYSAMSLRNAAASPADAPRQRAFQLDRTRVEFLHRTQSGQHRRVVSAYNQVLQRRSAAPIRQIGRVETDALEASDDFSRYTPRPMRKEDIPRCDPLKGIRG